MSFMLQNSSHDLQDFLLQFPPKGVMVLRTAACTPLLVLVYNCVCVCIPFETHVRIHM